MGSHAEQSGNSPPGNAIPGPHGKSADGDPMLARRRWWVRTEAGYFHKKVGHNPKITWECLPESPHGDRAQTLQQATGVLHQEAPQWVYTGRATLREWATTQSNLGPNSTSIFPPETVLRIFKQPSSSTRTPKVRDWKLWTFPWIGATQSNWANQVYRISPIGRRGHRASNPCGPERRRAADGLHRNGLSQWALTQTNPRNGVYPNAVRDRVERTLNQAPECYQAALRVHTGSRLSLDWR